MPRIEDIAFAFFSFRKTAKPMKLAQRRKTVLSPGENFMSVRLMTHIPDNLILRQIQTKMQRHGQFHGPQIGAQMPACHTDRPDQKFPDLRCQGVQIFLFYLLDIICLFYGFQKHIHHILSVSASFASVYQVQNQLPQKPVFSLEAVQNRRRFP